MKLLSPLLPLSALILILFTGLETLCNTYLLENGVRIDLVSITYVISGLSIAIIPLIANPQRFTTNLSANYSRFNTFFLFGFFVFLAIYTAVFSNVIFQKMVLDYHISDTVPQIKVMCQRLLSGHKVYAPIQEIWDGKQPPYLPFMWMPFSFAEIIGIDIRWTTIIFLLGGIYLTFRILPFKFYLHPALLFITCIFLFLLLNFLLARDKITIGRTEEGLVVGYYLFLGFALTKNKPVLIGIAIACCLLSRFALFFWVPMYLLYVLFYESKKKAAIITSVAAIIGLLFFVIPFGIQQPEYFLNIPADYKVGVNQAWNYNYNPETGIFYEKSLGYTKWFDIAQVHFLHNFQIIVAAVLPFLLLLSYYLFRKKISINQQFFGICTLKITLVFFYNMIEVPYYYLFLVSTFFSYAILFAFLKYVNDVYGSLKSINC